jgi:DNA-binding SARP family transcriptional activator
MEFRVLGPLEIRDGDRELTPLAPKLREVLALLLLRHNQIVPIHALIDELWGENPPRSAQSTLQTYVYKLRKIFHATGGAVDGFTLITKPAGYRVAIAPESIDAYRFEQLVKDGHSAAEDGDSRQAARSLAEALALWRGPALADVETGELLSVYVTGLNENRVRALELRIQADMRLGRHRELISELRELASGFPLHEGFHAQLMLALHRAGRRPEALEVYQSVRAKLIDELGIEPGLGLREIQQMILADTPPPEPQPTELLVTMPKLPATSMPPAQLPPDIDDFSGRAVVTEQIMRHVAPGRQQATAIRVALITGMVGVGKTMLAVHAAHQVSDAFEDGQLFADLCGSSAEDLAGPSEILGEFLRAVGVTPAQIPPGPSERSRMFRSWTRNRSLLIVLDDAVSASQVQPLLPASPTCGVVITSRSTLPGLAGARTFELSELDVAESVELLSSIVGRARVDEDPAAAEELARLCGQLPLAIRAAAVRLTSARAWPVMKVAWQLDASRADLQGLRSFGLDIRASLEPWYLRLAEPERSAFRLLSLLEGPDFTAGQAARLLGCDITTAEEHLVRLAEFHFVQVRGQDEWGDIRYRLHEFVRTFARLCLDEVRRDPRAGHGPGEHGPVARG